MIFRFKLLGLILAVAFVITACGGQPETNLTAPVAEAPATEGMPAENMEVDASMKSQTDAMAADDMQSQDAVNTPESDMGAHTGEAAPTLTAVESMDTTEEMMADLPSYFSMVLTNPSDGEQFTIADLKGKVILVENMAIWCTTCRRQQGEVKTLHGLLGERDDFVSLGLDIDPNESLEDLKSYVENNGFDWLYAVAPQEVAREFDQLYGSQFLNPPSAPMFIIDREGQVHPLPFGVKSAAELQAALQPFLNGEL
jgi:cytochrome oxidase Cu insertion factor (SCO1/SenC/PrrC family)